jgi:hypothetical protein
MPLLGFETTIPVFQRTETFHALDHTATVIGSCVIYQELNILICCSLRQMDHVNVACLGLSRRYTSPSVFSPDYQEGRGLCVWGGDEAEVQGWSPIV